MKGGLRRTNEIDARRIARNAGWLYARLCIVTVAGLFSVRIVMNALGVAGFGLFSAVSGAVSLIFFLQWTMELTVRRFLCVEIGADDTVGLRRAFSAGVCALPLFVLAGPLLVWWIGGQLPPEAVHFTRCVAVYLFFDALIGPLHTAIVATGRVFAYNVCVSSVMVSGFFLAWLCLSLGLPPWTSVGSVAFANVLAFVYRLCYVHRNLGVSVVQILRRAFVPTNVI